jgi:AcrR family transcriptional regulator
MVPGMQTAARTEATTRDATKRPRGRPRKTADERDDGNRRRALLRGAARLFRRKGFDATSTRDIAAAAGMQSGSPFYHFRSKQALLFAVMEEGMRHAVERQRQAIAAADMERLDPVAQLRLLVRHHFEVLLGADSDFIPVMLYEARSVTARQRNTLAGLQGAYEGAWEPVLRALHASGRLKADVKLARLLIFGALNWSVKWFDRRKGATLDELTDAALALFIGESP